MNDYDNQSRERKKDLRVPMHPEEIERFKEACAKQGHRGRSMASVARKMIFEFCDEVLGKDKSEDN